MDNKNKKAKKVIIIIAVILAVFLLVFALYDSPAKYVPTSDGRIYLDKNGEPILYYTDLFGNTFYEENGLRVYAAVPAYADDTPITVAPETTTDNQ